jgi:secreted Zn-dependent insulinase-like peptidase
LLICFPRYFDNLQTMFSYFSIYKSPPNKHSKISYLFVRLHVIRNSSSYLYQSTLTISTTGIWSTGESACKLVAREACSKGLYRSYINFDYRSENWYGSILIILIFMSMYVLYPSKGNNCWKSATFHSRFYHFELVPTEVHSILRGDNSQDKTWVAVLFQAKGTSH